MAGPHERAAASPAERMGVVAELFRGQLLRRTAVGVILATVGMATFWGAHIYGKDMLRNAVQLRFVAEAPSKSERLNDADLTRILKNILSC